MSKTKDRDEERRTGWDRRVGNRRKNERRKASVPVEKDRRKSGEDRRKGSKPRTGKERREVPDRRTAAWDILEGT